MPEPASDSGLVFQALLYVTGEMSAPVAAAFEEQLGCNPHAQEALCRAVELVQTSGRNAPTQPNLRYRRQVQRRLRRPPRRRWRSAFALSVVMLLVLTNFGLRTPDPQRMPDSMLVGNQDYAAEHALEIALEWADLSILDESHLARSHWPNSERLQAVADMADGDDEDVWAALNDGSHLAQAHEEFLRRQAESLRKRGTAQRGTRAATP